MIVIYQHIRKTDNTVFYIGIGNFKRPYVKTNRSNFWKNEVKKHGYIINILNNNLSFENAQESEIELIKIYGRRDLGLGTLVNLTNGGDGSVGCKLSIETKLKISKALIGKTVSLETRKKISENNKGKSKNVGVNNPRYGTKPLKNGNSPYTKKIINIITNQIWSCLKDCSEQNNIKKTTLAAWLNGQNKNISNFRYL